MPSLPHLALLILLVGTACAPPGIPVTGADAGPWPFTVSSGTLHCAVDGPRRYVTFETGNGIEYGLNGSAKTFGFPDSAAIQKSGTYGVDLQPFIARGLTLCR